MALMVAGSEFLRGMDATVAVWCDNHHRARNGGGSVVKTIAPRIANGRNRGNVQFPVRRGLMEFVAGLVFGALIAGALHGAGGPGTGSR